MTNDSKVSWAAGSVTQYSGGYYGIVYVEAEGSERRSVRVQVSDQLIRDIWKTQDHMAGIEDGLEDQLGAFAPAYVQGLLKEDKLDEDTVTFTSYQSQGSYSQDLETWESKAS